jgi:hypothetical protein
MNRVGCPNALRSKKYFAPCSERYGKRISLKRGEWNKSASGRNLKSRAGAPSEGGAPASQLYQNRIKTLSKTAIGVVRRAKSRFPWLLERLRKTLNGMDGLEGNFTRPRQVRYQAALRPDFLCHSF